MPWLTAVCIAQASLLRNKLHALRLQYAGAVSLHDQQKETDVFKKVRSALEYTSLLCTCAGGAGCVHSRSDVYGCVRVACECVYVASLCVGVSVGLMRVGLASPCEVPMCVNVA